MKERLIQELYMYMNSKGAADEQTKSELFLILNNYEVEGRKTDLVEYSNDEINQRMIREFIINKTVAGLTEKSLEHYQGRLDSILSRINKSVIHITANDLKGYIAARQVLDKVSPSTVISDYRVLSSFFNWMTTEEYIDKNPMLRVACPKSRKVKKSAFSQMEVEQIRSGCKSLRDKALVEVLLSTWCRVSEIQGMDITDIQGNTIKVLGKGKKERIVYLNAKAILAINRYLVSRTDNNPALFVSAKKPHKRMNDDVIRGVLKEVEKECGVKNVHPHRFRRTGATLALKSGMAIETVSYLLGHESIDTTQIYLDMEEDMAKQAHLKYVA